MRKLVMFRIFFTKCVFVHHSIQKVKIPLLSISTTNDKQQETKKQSKTTNKQKTNYKQQQQLSSVITQLRKVSVRQNYFTCG